ncbi:MAG: efflux RND transporter periplasmic adaptor subunit [Cyanobacteria bacterium K_DeepCast_35m_m2_023]|nr:efflux RND transporter periplasmic adaptor subunit [Cyanobacteria bacterium K_DeepCast_35m_m2_023]
MTPKPAETAARSVELTALEPSPRSARRPLWQRRRLWLGVSLVALVVAGGGALQWRRSSQQQASLARYTVPAQQGSLPGLISATGELDAIERVNLSPKRQGVLTQLYVDEGDRVRQGQAIALMDPGDLSDRLQELQANLRSAQANLVRSQGEWQRRRQLYRSGAISADDYNRAFAAYEVDRAAVVAARERLEQRGVERADLVVRAPFSGLISQRYADRGAFVTPTTTASSSLGATSSSIVELARGLEVVAKVPESDVGRLRVGQTASVQVDAFPDQRFAARIRQIAPRAIKTNNVNSFEVRLALVQPAPALRIGMTAEVDFQIGQVPARTLVPTVAVVTEDGRPGVLLVGERNQPKFQPVELGMSSGRNTQILSGLQPGTRFFTDLPPWAKTKR